MPAHTLSRLDYATPHDLARIAAKEIARLHHPRPAESSAAAASPEETALAVRVAAFLKASADHLGVTVTALRTPVKGRKNLQACDLGESRWCVLILLQNHFGLSARQANEVVHGSHTAKTNINRRLLDPKRDDLRRKYTALRLIAERL